MRRVAVAIGAFAAVSCGAIRVGDVGPPNQNVFDLVAVPGPQRIVLSPSDDAVVNSDPSWAGEALGEQEWLMVGSDPSREVYWLTYLTFELDVLSMESKYSAVLLQMPGSEGEDIALDVHVVADTWEEATITWDRQPGVSPSSIVRLSRRDQTCVGECGDITSEANNAIRNGRAILSLVVVPARPWEAGALRWNSIESRGESLASEEVPHLIMFVGEEPPPPTAARTDWLLGLD